MDLCTKLSITIMISPYFMESPLCWFAPEHHSFRTRQKKTSPLPVSRWRRRRTTTARKEFSTFNRRRRQHRLPVPFLRRKCEAQRFPKDDKRRTRTDGKSKPNNDALYNAYFLRGKKWSLGRDHETKFCNAALKSVLPVSNE